MEDELLSDEVIRSCGEGLLFEESVIEISLCFLATQANYIQLVSVPDDEGNDGPSSFETLEINFTTESITMQTITGIVNPKMRILSFMYTPLCRSKTITFFLMKIKGNI